MRAAVLFLCLAGCPAARPPVAHPTPAHAPPDAAPTLHPAELRVMHRDRVEGSLAADGTLLVGDRPVARMESARVVGSDGAVLARLDGHTLHLAGTSQVATLADDGSVTAPDGRSMRLDARGDVVFTDATQRDEHAEMRLHVEGLTAASRPAAGVLVMVLMFRARSVATP